MTQYWSSVRFWLLPTTNAAVSAESLDMVAGRLMKCTTGSESMSATAAASQVSGSWHALVTDALVPADGRDEHTSGPLGSDAIADRGPPFNWYASVHTPVSFALMQPS
jgi:hypothetical protein